MRTTDFSPLYRFSVGFDRMQRLVDAASRFDEAAYAYPPYNIEAHGEDAYRITMTVAGFAEKDLDVTVTENTLVISGRKRDEDKGVSYLHRGIAGRAFERRFELADHIKVVGANLENGLLHVDMVRELPEEKKPRKIAIGSKNPFKALTKKAA